MIWHPRFWLLPFRSCWRIKDWILLLCSRLIGFFHGPAASTAGYICCSYVLLPSTAAVLSIDFWLFLSDFCGLNVSRLYNFIFRCRVQKFDFSFLMGTAREIQTTSVGRGGMLIEWHPSISF
jgi:hypothetical protein